MKFCKPHWDALKYLVEDRGLMGLVASSGEEAMSRMADQLQRPREEDVVMASNFDPLAGATWAIYGNALELGGAYLIFPDDEGNMRCPICESEKHGGPDADWWFRNAVDEQHKRAVELGLISGRVQ